MAKDSYTLSELQQLSKHRVDRLYYTGHIDESLWLKCQPKRVFGDGLPENLAVARHAPIVTYHLSAGAGYGVYYTILNDNEVYYLGSAALQTFGARLLLRDKYKTLNKPEDYTADHLFETRCLRSNLSPADATHFENVFTRAWWIVVGRLSWGHDNFKNPNKWLLMGKLALVDLEQVKEDLLALLSCPDVSDYESCLWDDNWKDKNRPGRCDFVKRVNELISAFTLMQQQYKACGLADLMGKEEERKRFERIVAHITVPNDNSALQELPTLTYGTTIGLNFSKTHLKVLDTITFSHKSLKCSTPGQTLTDLIPIPSTG